MKSQWDFTTESDGLLRGEFTVNSCIPYDPGTCQLDLHDVCARLLDFDGMWGLYIINNEDLMGVCDGSIALLRGADLYSCEGERWSFKGKSKAGRTWRPRKQVGWIKTVLPVYDLPILPFQLQVDAQCRANLDNKRTILLPDAVECADPKLYKELIERDADIVYMTASGPIFKKGVL